ncbi:aldo/keto reductase [Micromonospora craniellae]|uniref:Aldo/keto reductase n=1 Tax=Micromonospora craniellae TaxID=2294034 RepID=A0A372FS88_9ACTN|nr:aldo/keto reductase [Micromonospora craniellae]QOC92297.1 aldo/keto reductase [Micromonospora craniellae]RFS43647.1 aldo/keto reductase [Micromonospora craniellae]
MSDHHALAARRAVTGTELQVAPLCFGGNVLGWTCDEQQSRTILDAYRSAGGNFIDTADQYSSWVAGNVGGESETIIGGWLSTGVDRGDVVIATKCGRKPGLTGLAPHTVRAAVDASLRRLGTDYIDLLYAHMDDPETDLDATLDAFDGLVRAGKVRYVAASNYGAERLTDALKTASANGWAPFVALQTHYNLVERAAYETQLRPVVARHDLACFPYYALASGFLTGKYDDRSTSTGPRAAAASRYRDGAGQQVIDALRAIADQRAVAVGAVALAWLAHQPTVVAPIASARTPEQLAELMAFAELALTPAELTALESASRIAG